MKSCHVLVVDDSLSNLALMKSILDHKGLVGNFVEDGEGALQKLMDINFDLMITDLNMPGMDGLELTRRAKELVPDMPIIMITGAITSDLPRLAAEAGVAKLLYKPYNPETIMNAMSCICATCEKG